MDFNQIKTGKGSYTIINADDINRIARVKAFEEKHLNDMLYEYHKQLLLYAKNRNNNKEVGFFWDLKNLNELPLIIKGKIDGFNIDDNIKVPKLVKDPYNVMSVVMMHNHPRNGMFSSKDIRSFTDFNSIILMTAVCNDGTIYMMRKEWSFKPFLMDKYYNEGSLLSQKAALEEKRHKAKKLGLNINNPNDKQKIDQLSTKAYYYGIKNVVKHAKEIGITYRCSVKRK